LTRSRQLKAEILKSPRLDTIERGIDMQVFRQALEGVKASILQSQPGSRNEIPNFA
jgi:hypothetical protein